jgi:hypothetical protein
MTKIETIDLSGLHQDEHFQFMTEVDSLIGNTTNATDLGFGAVYPLFQNVLTAEGAAMKVEQGSSLTPVIEALDEKRDKTWNAIHKRIQSTLISPFDTEETSASTLNRIMIKYGDPRDLNYNEASSAYAKLLQDLLLPANTADLAAVCINTWVPELSKQNVQFIALIKQRNTEVSSRGTGDVTSMRALVDVQYLDLVDKVNSTFSLGLNKPIATTFVNELNLRVKKYNTAIKTRASLRAKAKKAVAKTSTETTK